MIDPQLSQSSDLTPSVSMITQGWQAQLNLSFYPRGNKTVLLHKKQRGPLAVQRPFYPEDHICHAYLLHPPGGVVGGDSLTITARVAPFAHSLLTTPGATKFYRSCEGKIAQQNQTLVVEENSYLEWLPQENIFFSDAKVHLTTRIELAATARFMGWELHCFGRPALNEGLGSGTVTGKTEIWIANKRILTERVAFNGQDKRFIINGLQGFSLTASFFITDDSPELLAMVQALLDQQQQYYTSQQLVVAVTQIEGILVVRALAHWSETIMHVFVKVWQQVREQWLGYTPLIPRIWAT
ncbi:urease accessory protein UreD [Photobacterium aquimaris]|uniref:Urease accessory protein UreD n=1 Tax=Photobacterium aquimaris TaxID=512643 RepID=A0A1Y6KXN1_9GAMM|nr:urease accessory protein UreD [Photobacterium aquimaris]SMY16891.1 Urease accessory protein UreD [Photobacterium aquimaris]